MAYLDGRGPINPIQSYGKPVLENDLYENKSKRWVGAIGPGAQKPRLTINRTFESKMQVLDAPRAPEREGSMAPSYMSEQDLGYNNNAVPLREPIQAGITGFNAEYSSNPFIGYGGTYIASQYMYGGLSGAFEFVNGKYEPKVLHQHSASMREFGGAKADNLVRLGLLPPIQDRPWYGDLGGPH